MQRESSRPSPSQNPRTTATASTPSPVISATGAMETKLSRRLSKAISSSTARSVASARTSPGAQYTISRTSPAGPVSSIEKESYCLRQGPGGDQDWRRRYFQLDLPKRILICTPDDPRLLNPAKASASPDRPWNKGKLDSVSPKRANARLVIMLRGGTVDLVKGKEAFCEFEIEERGRVVKDSSSPTPGGVKKHRTHRLRAESEKELYDWLRVLKKATQQNKEGRSSMASTGRLDASRNQSKFRKYSTSITEEGEDSMARFHQALAKDKVEKGVTYNGPNRGSGSSGDSSGRYEEEMAIAGEVEFLEFQQNMHLGNTSVIMHARNGKSAAEVITVETIKQAAHLTWGGRLTNSKMMNRGNHLNLSNGTHLALMERGGGKVRHSGRVGGSAIALTQAQVVPGLPPPGLSNAGAKGVTFEGSGVPPPRKNSSSNSNGTDMLSSQQRSAAVGHEPCFLTIISPERCCVMECQDPANRDQLVRCFARMLQTINPPAPAADDGLQGTSKLIGGLNVS